ncbi:FAS1 domain-containing protein [Tuber borchii]|uniref:FAS1 domain-containing protein n=1 Tax=Tuber borchii TaxID=42251 RepID=A0A2T6ZP20_TUBBO|nr:FAS1 domain-containing protein [Tuber borchii]
MILSIPLLAAAFLSLAPLVSCQTPTSDKTLMQALADIPECQKYYQFLQRHPEAQSPPPGQDNVVFCPTNDAVDSKLAAPAGSKVKRDETEAIVNAAMQTAQGPKVTKGIPTTSARASVTPSPSTGTNSIARAPRKRQVTSVFTSLLTVVHSSTTSGAASTTAGGSPGGSLATSTAIATGFRTSGSDPLALDPNQLTLLTTLKDPAFVNLGPGEAARMVSFGSPLTSANTNLKLSGGLGNVINVIRGNIPFNLGVIHIVDNFVTLPNTLSQSLTKLGQNLFLSALTNYNLIGVFENTPRITAFVPIDSSLSGNLSECACKQHVLEGPPLYTPDIELGKPYTTEAGGNITIEIRNGEYTLPGGATIVKANVITKNGVVHFIKGTISGDCAITPFTGGSNKKGVWMGGLFGLVGAVVGLLV